VQAAYHGVNLKDATLYTTFSPCLMCAKMAINAGIKKIVFNVDYPLSGTAAKILREAGVKMVKHKI
jgi:dCMP deaminase